jgi:HD-GYP domain-containing protein (c-di-GMP phosphodiesterase class II)
MFASCYVYSFKSIGGVPNLYTKPVNLLEIGDVLAEDIIEEQKMVFTSGTILTLEAILKLQSLQIPYVKVSCAPCVTSNQIQTDVFSDITKRKFFEFLIKNNKDNRYSILISDKKELQFITNIVFPDIDEKVNNLLSALRSWDIYAFNHVVDVFIIGTLWMRHLGMTPTIADSYGFLLHDIGKLKIARHILLKNGKLNETEYELIKKHTDYGSEILKNLQFANIVCTMAKYHHVRFNGKGYPHSFPDNLDIQVKILMITDVFSALTLDRPYRKSYSFKEGLSILQKEKDGFDTELFANFISFIEQKLDAFSPR